LGGEGERKGSCGNGKKEKSGNKGQKEGRGQFTGKLSQNFTKVLLNWTK